MNCEVSRYTKNNLNRTTYHFNCRPILTIEGPAFVTLSAVSFYRRSNRTDPFEYVRTWIPGTGNKRRPRLPRTVAHEALATMRSQLILDSKVHG